MPLIEDLKAPYIRVHLIGTEESFPTLQEVTNFLYDINVTYDLLRLATDAKYLDFKFSHNAFFRRGRPLEEEDRLQVDELRLASPIDLVGVVLGVPVAVAAVWGLVQIVTTVYNVPLERKKKLAELEKLQLEIEKLRREPAEPMGLEDLDQTIDIRLREREASHLVCATAKRLSESRIQVKDVTIEVVQAEELVRRKRGRKG